MTSSTPTGPAFPTTQWSRILAAPGRRDLDALARSYERPIRAWLRARVRVADEALDDLVQDMFAWLLESGLLDRADPARGRFRALLKTALANFTIERHRRETAQKRGGAHTRTPLEDADALVDPAAPTPDQVLDRAWRRELLERAHEQLRSELVAADRTLHYAVFRDYFLAGDEPDHTALAERHGITRTDVQNRLAYSKRRYRAILETLVTDTVGTPADLQEELRWLFGGNADGSPLR